MKRAQLRVGQVVQVRNAAAKSQRPRRAIVLDDLPWCRKKVGGITRAVPCGFGHGVAIALEDDGLTYQIGHGFHQHAPTWSPAVVNLINLQPLESTTTRSQR